MCWGIKIDFYYEYNAPLRQFVTLLGNLDFTLPFYKLRAQPVFKIAYQLTIYPVYGRATYTKLVRIMETLNYINCDWFFVDLILLLFKLSILIFIYFFIIHHYRIIMFCNLHCIVYFIIYVIFVKNL